MKYFKVPQELDGSQIFTSKGRISISLVANELLTPKECEQHGINIKKLQMISEWVKAHHEKWDGRGYPDGLKGEEIPLAGRIIALADTYDAMTSTRPYRTALSHEVAIAEIQRCSGTQFDPKLAEVFVGIQDKINAARLEPEKAYIENSLLSKNVDIQITTEFSEFN